MQIIKCPRCEINFIYEKDDFCPVCKREMRGEKKEGELPEICIECAENPVAAGEDICHHCLGERKRLEERKTIKRKASKNHGLDEEDEDEDEEITIAEVEIEIEDEDEQQQDEELAKQLQVDTQDEFADEEDEDEFKDGYSIEHFDEAQNDDFDIQV